MRFLRPWHKPKQQYPNRDRFGEDGRRIYSAWDRVPSRRAFDRLRRRRNARVALFAAAVVIILIVLAFAVLG
ncbi:hypothetical protein SAMN04488498_1654 [Mesorhizobium albiziae]|uniref:Uncharacterized protein n=1 Tax=Neomesorhizobium albiziae TaxID=335020 RepID=A0A1I4FY78_9HYPH|nr:hypothetical protein GCM10007937_09010 [Mesorhizobium albiziae]SFL22439.1 hypothetical protein SAMN04488498_1654 [Mesorhizobium albiziae]